MLGALLALQLLGVGPSDGGPPVSAAQAAALMPQPSTSIPPGPTPSGAAGVAPTYQPSDAIPPSLCRRTSTTTATDGTFAVTWKDSKGNPLPLISNNPWAGVDPIWASASMPPICWMITATAAAVTGKCVQTQTTTVTTALVTSGLTVNPFGGGAAGLQVKVHACEPTQ